ncbi:MAG TPA: hypothetical protein VHA10_13705 [Hypericibacter adhaerens]|uniref:hypothetical protein n=1 Tax=Hypericibacter adhaerens TaxID=2602016 RepID=UPI002CCF56FF|nr:hypothetical protein [Hypericibacter adhaerens]HWA44262.1 hypothetical protein [Hypericibacter adhaerens]
MSRIVVLLSALLVLAGCANTQPVYNVDHHPMPEAARNLPVDRIGELIVKAGEQRQWTFQRAGTGHLVATQIDGRYAAVIDIYFDQSNYSITKKSTSGFPEENGEIHRRYNNWIHYLEGDINAQLATAAP